MGVPRTEAETIHRKAQSLLLRYQHQQLDKYKEDHGVSLLLAKIHTEQEILKGY